MNRSLTLIATLLIGLALGGCTIMPKDDYVWVCPKKGNDDPTYKRNCHLQQLPKPEEKILIIPAM